MGGGCDHPGAVLPGRLDRTTTRLPEASLDFGDGAAHPGIGLDLRPHELADDLVLARRFARLGKDPLVGIRNHVAGLRIDDHQLLFDTQGNVGHCDTGAFPINAYSSSSLRVGPS